MAFKSFYGVDFSGAKLAGRNTWVAQIEPVRTRRRPAAYALVALGRLEDLCGAAERAVALKYLVDVIAQSTDALWALDFPFGLPLELMPAPASWPSQLELLDAWGEDAYGVGLECLRRAKALGGPQHLRRLTDVEAKSPFNSYHYRIIYQTFYGMRDVLGPLRRKPQTAILPFQYRRLAAARRVIVEACPASTLKRLMLPHQNYKQPEGGPLTPKRLRTRRAILAGLHTYVEITAEQQRVIMRNGGGDALDAVIAAAGAAQSWPEVDHRAIARHPRYPREGRMYI